MGVAEMAKGGSRSSASWVFGLLLLIFLIWVFVFAPDTLPDYKQRMLGVFLALLGGLFAFFLTGDIGLEIQWIQSRFGELGIKATGGVAVFVLVLVWWWSPLAPIGVEKKLDTILKETLRQTALVQNPVVRVLPEEEVYGEVAKFDLEIKNTGIADVGDLKIYEDYFVSLTPPKGLITFNRFGLIILKPDKIIPVLNRGESQPFQIEFRDVHKQMTQFYLSEVKGPRMMVARLLIKYRRLEDGKEFRTSKAYVIAGHGDLMLDYDERGVSSPGGPTFSDIKQVLGVSVK